MSMSASDAEKWLAYSTRRDDIAELIRQSKNPLVTVAELLSLNPVINTRLRRRAEVKAWEIVCACGCGEHATVMATRRLKYIPEHKHRKGMREWQRRRRAQTKRYTEQQRLLKGDAT